MSSNPPADATRPAAEPAAAPAGCYRSAALGASRGLARRHFVAQYAHPRTPSTERNGDPVREEKQRTRAVPVRGEHRPAASARPGSRRAGFFAGTGARVPPPRASLRNPEPRRPPAHGLRQGDGLGGPSRSNPGRGYPLPPHRSPAREPTGGPRPREGRCDRGWKPTQE